MAIAVDSQSVTLLTRMQTAPKVENLDVGVFYSKHDRVRLENGWRERLRKETDTAAAAGGSTRRFQMNLANCSGSCGLPFLKHSHNRIEIVAEKEIKQTPQTRMSLKGMDPNSFEVMAIKHTAKRPTEKWDIPMSTSHEIGWLLAKPVRAATLRGLQTSSRSSSMGNPVEIRNLESAGATCGTPVSKASGMGNLGATGTLRATGSSAVSFHHTFNSQTMPTSEEALERRRNMPDPPRGPSHDCLARLNNPKWRRPLTSFEETRYAETYVSIQKHDPFNKAKAGR